MREWKKVIPERYNATRNVEQSKRWKRWAQPFVSANQPYFFPLLINDNSINDSLVDTHILLSLMIVAIQFYTRLNFHSHFSNLGICETCVFTV